MNVPETFVDWIKALYAEAKIRPYINGTLGGEIPVRNGVRQGDPISYPLFVAVIEGLA